MSDEETTSRLEQTLREISDDDTASDFIREHANSKVDSFSGFILEYIGEHDLALKDIVSGAGFGEYAYHYIDGTKKPVNRDHVISICIAAGMSVKETDRALRLAGQYPLNPKDERDVRINKEITNITEVNLELDRFGLQPLV